MATLKFTWQDTDGRRQGHGNRTKQFPLKIKLKNTTMKCTYEGGIGEDDLRLVGQDVELDDVSVAVPVDDLRVCGKEAKKQACEN